MNENTDLKKELQEMLIKKDKRLTIEGPVRLETYDIMKIVAASSNTLRIMQEIIIQQPMDLIERMEQIVCKRNRTHKGIILLDVDYSPRLNVALKAYGNQEITMVVRDFAGIETKIQEIPTDYNGSLISCWRTFMYEGIGFRLKIQATEEQIPKKRKFFKSSGKMFESDSYEGCAFDVISKCSDYLWRIVLENGKIWYAHPEEIFEVNIH